MSEKVTKKTKEKETYISPEAQAQKFIALAVGQRSDGLIVTGKSNGEQLPGRWVAQVTIRTNSNHGFQRNARPIESLLRQLDTLAGKGTRLEGSIEHFLDGTDRLTSLSIPYEFQALDLR